MLKYGLPLLPSGITAYVVAFGAQQQKTRPSKGAIFLKEHMAIIDDYGAIAVSVERRLRR